MEKDTKNTRNDLHGPDPFISQNVWLKRLGLIILLGGLGYHISPLFTIIVVVLFIVTYLIKQFKGFFSSLWNS